MATGVTGPALSFLPKSSVVMVTEATGPTFCLTQEVCCYGYRSYRTSIVSYRSSPELGHWSGCLRMSAGTAAEETMRRGGKRFLDLLNCVAVCIALSDHISSF